MSLAAMTWAIAQKIPRPTHKLVLIILANRVNAAALAPVSFPSVASICADTSLDRKTVMAALAELQTQGVIEDTGTRYGATRQVTCFRLRIAGYAPDNSPKNGTLSGEKMIDNSPVFPQPPPNLACEESRKRDTESVTNQDQEQPKRKRGAARAHFAPPALPNWLPLPAWNAWLEVRTIKRAFLTEYAMRLSLGTLLKLAREGHDPQAVLDQSTANNWTGLFPVKSETRGNTRRATDNSAAAAEAVRLIHMEAEEPPHDTH